MNESFQEFIEQLDSENRPWLFLVTLGPVARLLNLQIAPEIRGPAAKFRLAVTVSTEAIVCYYESEPSVAKDSM